MMTRDDRLVTRAPATAARSETKKMSFSSTFWSASLSGSIVSAGTSGILGDWVAAAARAGRRTSATRGTEPRRAR